MVFSFMLLMSTSENQPTLPGQKGPRHEDAGRSRLAAVSFEKIGRLVKRGDGIYLKFDNTFYNPVTEMDRLEADQRIAILGARDGSEKRVLYLEEDPAHPVLLTEYLHAFQHLSRRGIGIAFAERIK